MILDLGYASPGEFRCWGPYVSYGRSAATQAHVTWNSKFHALERWIDYGPTPSCGTRLGERLTESETIHSFFLDGLAPSTTYYFRISRPEDMRATAPPVYSFTTGPPDGVPVPGGFTFAVLSDMHNAGSVAYPSVVRNAPGTRFIVDCGDAITHGGEEDRWNEFFHSLTPHATRFPFMNVTGNHDTDHPETYARFVKTFRHPYHDPSLGAFYHFTYANALFVMLDSTNAGQAKGKQGLVSDEQLDWLEGILRRHARRDAWVFVCMHHTFYSAGNCANLISWYEMAYKDLFDEHHVDCVFYGHDHSFEVYWTGRDEPWGGTHYVLTGNAGRDIDTDRRDPARNPPPMFTWPGRTLIPSRDGVPDGALRGDPASTRAITDYLIYGVLESGFTSCTVDGDALELRAIGRDNQTYFEDRFERTGTGKRYHPPRRLQAF